MMIFETDGSAKSKRLGRQLMRVKTPVIETSGMISLGAIVCLKVRGNLNDLITKFFKEKDIKITIKSYPMNKKSWAYNRIIEISYKDKTPPDLLIPHVGQFIKVMSYEAHCKA